ADVRTQSSVPRMARIPSKRRWRSQRLDRDPSAARSQPELLASVAERTVERPPRDFALDAQRQVRMDVLGFGVDQETDVGIDRHGNAASRGLQRAASGVALGEGRVDRSARGFGDDASTGVSDANASARGMNISVAGDSVQGNGPAGGFGVQLSLEMTFVDTAARCVHPAIPAYVAPLDGYSRGVRLQIRAQIMDGDRSSGSVELGGSLERGGFDRASRRVDVHRGFVRHLELKHHAARTERKEVMLALGGNGDRARALVE